MACDSARFYADLPPVVRFDRFVQPAAYVPAPEDWVALAGDVKGSTAAIEAGRYKEVNMVGAAVITAVLNACPDADLPFAFGGDGGVVLVPGNRAEAAADALRRLQQHSRAVFGLDLRAAAVPLARLRAEGHEIRVGRLALNTHNHLAMFSGTGMFRLDEILKGKPDDPDLLHPPEAGPPPSLDGLSCRWEPLAASRGRMIALMVRSTAAEVGVSDYAEIVSGLNEILRNLPAHAPATDESLRLRWPPRGAWTEARAAGAGVRRATAFAWVLVSGALQRLAHRYGWRIGAYDAPRYLEEIKAQTDFRRFDGFLRVVLDCSPAEVEAIRAWLESQYRARRLVYGLHEDRSALMTCLVFSLEQARHIHFVDAAGGGFAKAAEDYKRRAQRWSDATAP